jgi:hypothetical protein
MKNPKFNLAKWLDALRSHGRYSFTRAEAAKAYGSPTTGLSMALHRQMQAHRIAKPRAGFYLILDPPYRDAGSLPPEWYVDDLMKYLGLPYYVGGLSAAAHYGATHQALQEMQVVVPGDRKGLRPVECGRSRIRFLLKSSFKLAAIQQAKSQAGYYKIASPETAAWDLIYLASSLGGLDQAALALPDMASALNADRLKSLAALQHDSTTSRRLGWVLEKCGLAGMASALRPKNVLKEPWRMVESGAFMGGANRNEAWHLIENISLDLEA